MAATQICLLFSRHLWLYICPLLGYFFTLSNCKISPAFSFCLYAILFVKSSLLSPPGPLICNFISVVTLSLYLLCLQGNSVPVKPLRQRQSRYIVGAQSKLSELTLQNASLALLPGINIMKRMSYLYPNILQCLVGRRASLVTQMVRNPLAMQETQVLSLRQEYPLEKEMGYPLQNSCLENSMDRGAW